MPFTKTTSTSNSNVGVLMMAFVTAAAVSVGLTAMGSSMSAQTAGRVDSNDFWSFFQSITGGGQSPTAAPAAPTPPTRPTMMNGNERPERPAMMNGNQNAFGRPGGTPSGDTILCCAPSGSTCALQRMSRSECQGNPHFIYNDVPDGSTQYTLLEQRCSAACNAQPGGGSGNGDMGGGGPPPRMPPTMGGENPSGTPPGFPVMDGGGGWDMPSGMPGFSDGNDGATCEPNPALERALAELQQAEAALRSAIEAQCEAEDALVNGAECRSRTPGLCHSGPRGQFSDCPTRADGETGRCQEGGSSCYCG